MPPKPVSLLHSVAAKLTKEVATMRTHAWKYVSDLRLVLHLVSSDILHVTFHEKPKICYHGVTYRVSLQLVPSRRVFPAFLGIFIWR
jgi:hypothetical protein